LARTILPQRPRPLDYRRDRRRIVPAHDESGAAYFQGVGRDRDPLRGVVQQQVQYARLAEIVAAGEERRLERIVEAKHPGERADAVRLATAKLSDEEIEHGRRLLARSDALSEAYAALLAEETPDMAHKAQTLEVLGELREEASAEYSRYREEMGIPGPAKPEQQ
jgi:hypothetical protein